MIGRNFIVKKKIYLKIPYRYLEIVKK